MTQKSKTDKKSVNFHVRAPGHFANKDAGAHAGDGMVDDSNTPQVNESRSRPVNGMIAELTIDAVDSDGYGVGQMGDYRVLVPDTAGGDVITVRIDHVSRQAPTAWGRPFEVHQRGLGWKKHFCRHAIQSQGQCGGCPLGHLARDVYREVKESFVRTELESAGLPLAAPTLECGLSFHYRNKSNFVVSRKRGGPVQLGSFAPRSHRFAAMSGCKINWRVISKVQQEIEVILTEADFPVFPSPDGVRYATVKAFNSGAVLVDLVVAGETPEPARQVSQRILQIDSVHGVTVTCNSSDGNRIRSDVSHRMGGKEMLLETIGDVSLWMGAVTFFQLNNEIAKEMYRRAAEWCNGAAVIWDLYCGIGGLGLTAARQTGGRLFGCDNVHSAVTLAQKNGEANRVDARFDVIHLADSFPGDWPHPDVVLTNPPRKGMEPAALRKLCEIAPRTIVYMSCSPASFARDAALLVKQGYALADTALFDMLPNTAHVEMLGRFTCNR